MGLITPQEVEVKWNGTSKENYIKKGYNYTKRGDIFKCKVEDLSKGSSVKVKVECDFCNKINYIAYKGYLKNKSSKYYCRNCFMTNNIQKGENEELILNKALYRDKEWLHNEYIIKNRTAEDIANDFGINPRSLREWIGIFNLKKEGQKTKLITKEILEDLYSIQRKTTTEIGNMYGVSEWSITKLLKKYNIYIPTNSERMKYYHRHKGGIEKFRKIFGSEENRIACSCRQRGISPSEFDGFKKDEDAIIRNSSKYSCWRKAVFKRDDYTCQCCGHRNGIGKGKELNAHHIRNFSKNLDLRFDINNGITLCEECHQVKYENSFHRIYGEKDNTPEQLLEYISDRKNKID